MTDFERFVDWIRREAASHNEPPETPTALLWEGLEAALQIDNAAQGNGEDDSVAVIGANPDQAVAEPVLEARAHYHDPPKTPREPMWQRIEAAWLLRRSAPSAAREAGLSVLEGADAPFDLDREREGEEGPRRRSVALWLTGLAVAASILFGFVIGRGMPTLDPAAPQIARQPTQVPTRVDESSTEGEEAVGSDAGSSEPTLNATDPSLEPLETGIGFASVATSLPRRARIEPAVDAARAGERAETRPDRRQVVARYATNAHLGRTEMLFAAFGAGDADPGQLTDVAQTARNLLGETRLLLDMSVTRSQRERALLEDVELLLAQIARLGPNAPAFERDIVSEGLERLGTVASLREFAPQIGM